MKWRGHIRFSRYGHAVPLFTHLRLQEHASCELLISLSCVVFMGSFPAQTQSLNILRLSHDDLWITLKFNFPGRVLVLKSCQKDVLFGTFSG